MDIFTETTKALFNFLNGLGYEVYFDNNIKKGANFPYISISYEVAPCGEDGLIQGRIWDNGNSRAKINSISDKLLKMIDRGIILKANGENGYIYLTQGSPFIQPIVDETGLQVNYFNIIMKTYY